MIFSADNKVYNFSNKQLRNMYISYAAEFEETYAKAYVTWISPKDYLSLTYPGDVQSFLDNAKPLDYKELCNQQPEMFLRVNFEKGEVVGHEGRHRMAALHNAGANMVAVTIIPSNQDDKYNRQFIERLKVKGQTFPIDPPNKATGEVELRCLTPVSIANKELIYYMFGPVAPLLTFVGKKLYAVEDLFQFCTGKNVSERKTYLGTIKGLSDNPDYSKVWNFSSPLPTPFKVSYVHIHNETNLKGHQDYAIKLSDFLNWTKEGKYAIPAEKASSLDELINTADIQRQTGLNNRSDEKEKTVER